MVYGGAIATAVAPTLSAPPPLSTICLPSQHIFLAPQVNSYFYLGNLGNLLGNQIFESVGGA